MRCQRVPHDFTAHGSAWQLLPKTQSRKESPRDGLRPLIRFLVTPLVKTELWSDPNGVQREIFLVLETEKNQGWPPFGGNSTGFMPSWKGTCGLSSYSWLTFSLTTELIVELFQGCWRCYFLSKLMLLLSRQ